MTTTFNCGTNYLAPNGFKVSINKENFANLEFLAQSIQHPDISLDPAEIAFPRVTSIPMLGESVTMGALTIEVIMDEDMNAIKNYMIGHCARQIKNTIFLQASSRVPNLHLIKTLLYRYSPVQTTRTDHSDISILIPLISAM